MTSPFIPRSERQAQQNRDAFERSQEKARSINQANEDFWKKKAEEDKSYLDRINKQRRVV